MRFLSVVLLFLFQQALAQDYNLDHYTDENGLPQNSVKSITTDNAGFIWLATENGLVRYDGQKFVLFDKNQSKASSNRITNFSRDIGTNRLYALSENWQIIEIKDGHVVPSPQPFHQVFKFGKDPKANYYFSNGVPNFLAKYVDVNPYLITIDKSTVYKIFKGTLSFYKNENLLHSIHFNYKDQWRFFVLGKKLYYLDEQRNLTCFEDGKAIRSVINGEQPSETAQLAGKIYWNTCTGNVLLNIGNSLYSLEKSQKDNTLVSKRVIDKLDLDELGIISIYQDPANGTIYMGSFTKGLYIYRKKDFQSLNPKKSTLDFFYAQVPFGRDQVLYANGYLFKEDKNVDYFDLLKNNSENFSLTVDRTNHIWAPNDYKVHQFSPDLKKIIKTYSFPTKISIVYQSPLTDAELWFGGVNGIYKMGKSDTAFVKFNTSINTYNVSYLKRTTDRLWIGTHKGLYVYNFKNKNTLPIAELENKDIRSILIRKNEVWITTYGDGIYLHRNGITIKLPNDINNYLNTSHCILEDRNGFFWISTNKGLFEVAIADLLAYADQKVNSVFYLYYNRAAGFSTNEFNGGCQPCGSVLDNGYFTFPSMNGMVLFDPSAIKVNQPFRPIFIDKIILDNEEVKMERNTLAVPNAFNRLNLYLVSPYFGNKENLVFEYRLEDQQQWTQSTDQVISYSSLPPGKNVLKIRKANGFGQNNYTYKDITIIVPLHMYQTWWFICMVVLVVILAIYLYIKLRIKIIRKRNIQLEESISERTTELQNTIKAYETSQKRLEQHGHFQRRLIAAITHDIKSPLKYLMITGESLYKGWNNDKIDLEGLKAMYVSSSQIYHFTENLLTYAKGFTNEDLNIRTTFNLNALIEEKIRIFQGIANSQGTTIHNLIDKKTMVETNEQLLSVILHNLLDNAVKFTNVGEVIFLCKVHQHKTHITIKDTGIGMKPYQVLWCNQINDHTLVKGQNTLPLDAGLGLIMVRELIIAIGAEIHVVSTLGRGTTFEITI